MKKRASVRRKKESDYLQMEKKRMASPVSSVNDSREWEIDS